VLHDCELLCWRTIRITGTRDVGTVPLRARYPPAAVTNELARAVIRGEAPRPTGYHGTGRAREPIWLKTAIDNFIKPDSDTSGPKNLASLV